MSKQQVIANVLIVFGVGSLAVAGWWIHPSAGLLVIGVGLLVVGVGIGLAKSKAQDK